MKYTYKTVTDNQNVELPREWERLLAQFDSSEQWNNEKHHQPGRKYVRQIISLEAMSYEGESMAAPDNTAEEAERFILSDAAREIIATLPTQERRVMELLYDEELSGAEAALLLGVSQPYITQAKNSALKKIRRKILNS